MRLNTYFNSVYIQFFCTFSHFFFVCLCFLLFCYSLPSIKFNSAERDQQQPRTRSGWGGEPNRGKGGRGHSPLSSASSSASGGPHKHYHHPHLVPPNHSQQQSAGGNLISPSPIYEAVSPIPVKGGLYCSCKNALILKTAQFRSYYLTF